MISKRAWSWIGSIGAIVLVLAAFWADLYIRAGRTIDRHRREYEIALGRWRAAEATRQPLFGPELPGNAWDRYRPALAAFKAMSDAEKNACPSWVGPPQGKLDPPIFKTLVWDKYAPQLEALRDGLRCRIVEPGYDIDQGFGMLLPEIAPSMTATKVLADAAAFHHVEGRDGQALDVILVGAGFAQDLAFRGPLVCHLIAIVDRDILLWKLRGILDGHSLSPAELEAACRLLDLMAPQAPTIARTLEMEDLVARSALLKMTRYGADAQGMFPWEQGSSAVNRARLFGLSARYGFSGRAMMAESLNQWKELVEASRRLAALPPERRETESEREISGILDRGNPVTSMILPSLRGVWKNTAAGDMTFALARLSLAVAWYEAEHHEVPPSPDALVPRYIAAIPRDPMTGSTFRYIPSAGTAKVYSIGRDGKDDGGRPLPEGNVEGDGDVVWTIRRR